MDTNSIIVSNTDQVSLINFNRSERRNAMNQNTRQEVVRIFNDLAEDHKTSAVIISGENKAFCAGQDLNEAKDFSLDHIDTWIDEHLKLYRAVISFPKPVIAAIDGCCVGAGLQIALLCDFRIGTPNSFYVMPELNDAIPCILGIWTLWDLIGRGRTTEMVFTNRRVLADEALQWNLINEIVPSSELSAYTIKKAKFLAGKSRLAFYLTKSRVAHLMMRNMEELTAYAKYAHMRAFASGEPSIAMTDFLHK